MTRVLKRFFGAFKKLFQNYIFIFVIITFLLTRIFLNFPSLTEKIYSNGIYRIISVLLSYFSGIYPFSLDDTMYISLILALISLMVFWITGKIKFKNFFSYLIKLLGIVYIVFNWLWGFNYYRYNVYHRMDFQYSTLSKDDFIKTFDQLLQHTIENYKPDYQMDLNEINTSIEDSYSELSNKLELNYPNGKRRPKQITFSRFFAGTSVSGYFGPFFNEIHLNKYLLPVQVPMILAHEKAHQFGITNEGEASFMAWLVCENCNNENIKYSADLYILTYFLPEIRYNPDLNYLFDKIPSEIVNDLQNLRDYWNKLRYPILDKIQTRLYDLYLKGNHIHDGIRNYSGVVEMICNYEKNYK